MNEGKKKNNLRCHAKKLGGGCSDNCQSKQNNNPQDWPDECTTLMLPRNDFLISIIHNINVKPIVED